MATLNFPETQIIPGHQINTVPSPAGWVTTGIHVINLNAKSSAEDERSAEPDLKLSQAAKLTEQLIDALKESLSVVVPVSYMRVEKDTSFHILLLIKDDDFHSPRIVAARLLAEKFAKTEGINIKFVFAIESENRMNNTIRFGGYKLMHKDSSEGNADPKH